MRRRDVGVFVFGANEDDVALGSEPAISPTGQISIPRGAARRHGAVPRRSFAREKLARLGLVARDVDVGANARARKTQIRMRKKTAVDEGDAHPAPRVARARTESLD